MKMTPETALAHEVQLWCGENGYIIIRQQSGVFYAPDGSRVKIGFPGLSDYLVIGENGVVAFVETKVKPNKPTTDQLRFIAEMQRRNIRAGVVYNVDDLKKLLR